MFFFIFYWNLAPSYSFHQKLHRWITAKLGNSASILRIKPGSCLQIVITFSIVRDELTLIKAIQVPDREKFYIGTLQPRLLLFLAIYIWSFIEPKNYYFFFLSRIKESTNLISTLLNFSTNRSIKKIIKMPTDAIKFVFSLKIRNFSETSF